MAGAAPQPKSAAGEPVAAIWPDAETIPGSTDFRAALGHSLRNYFPTLFVIGFGILFYTTLSQYFIRQYHIEWTPKLGDHVASLTIDMPFALQFFALIYAVVLIPYYLARPGHASSAATAFAYLSRRARKIGAAEPSETEKQAMLCLLLKFIFVPFCIHGMLVYLVYLNAQIVEFSLIGASGAWPDAFSFYNSHLHYFILNLIFLFDFVPFVIGYLIQAKTLGNEIVSVDSSLLGWTVCLMCYPPFNAAVVELLPFQVFDLVPAYPTFSVAVHLALNATLLICFALYASASVSLGFKCSNLTNRGTVDSGLYGTIRHPAYVFKNIAWWIGALPFFYTLLQQSILTGVWAMVCLGGWSGIYMLRAIREERHMLSGNNGYQEYTQRVRYRFVPGLL
jgi:protein-S-isoprenylcysteine O-methyltransferase Ste14